MVRATDVTLMALVAGVAVLLFGCGGDDDHGHSHDIGNFECAGSCKVSYECDHGHLVAAADEDKVKVELSGCPEGNVEKDPHFGSSCKALEDKFKGWKDDAAAKEAAKKEACCAATNSTCDTVVEFV